MTNREIAEIMDRIADILEIKEDNPFKIRAYRKAARSICHLDEDINYLYKLNRISEIPGVGKAVKSKIEELLEKGNCEYYDKLLLDVPSGVLEMLSIPGIGHKTVKLIYEELGINNIDDLLKAAQNKEIRKIPGVGGKTEYNIKKGIDLLKKRTGKVTLGLALPLAEDFLDHIKESRAVQRACIVGSVRRGKSLVGDIDILVAANDYSRVYQKVSTYKSVRSISSKDSKHIKGKLIYQIDFEIIIVDPDDYFYSLVWTTGSKEHRNALFKGINPAEFSRVESEKDVFRKLGLNYIPPELREDQGEIEKASNNQLPKLVQENNLKGDLHVHSDWSDGAHKINEVVDVAKTMNYSYIAITDHSKSLPISGGLNEERLSAQGKVIDGLNKNQKDFQILRGIEVDILKDGQLDFSDDVLKNLDVVVASVHSNFKLEGEKQTQRIIRAIKNEHVDIIGHLTGRLLNRRSAYELDIDKVLEAAADNKIILEINSHPDRLDIDEVIAKKARDYGIKIAINSDAHHKEDLRLVKYGVINARRGWLEAENIVNTWDKEALLDYLNK